MRSRTAEQVVAYIAASIEVDSNGCHVWTKSLHDGYGRLVWRPSPDEPRLNGAHRVAARLAFGPLPAGKVIDHLCRNRACVNSDHMEVVTQMENVYRSPIAIATINAAKTHCAQGHEFSPENTRIVTWPHLNKRARVCKTCARAASARSRAKRVAA